MVTLHLPCVLVEVRDGVAVAVEGTFELSEGTADGLVGLLIGAFIVVIADGIEHHISAIFVGQIADDDVADQLDGLALEGIGSLTQHTADDGTKACQLVSVGDGQFSLGRIVPGEIIFAVPLGRLCNHGNLREGSHSNSDKAGGGIIVELIVSSQLAQSGDLSHFDGLSAFHVEDLHVAQVQTNVQHLAQLHDDGSGVGRRHALHVNVQRSHALAVTGGDIAVGGNLGGHGEVGGSCTISHLDAFGQSCLNICVVGFDGGIANGLALVVNSYFLRTAGSVDTGSGRSAAASVAALGPLGIDVIVAAEAVLLVCILSCQQLDLEAVAQVQVLIIITGSLLHLQSNGNLDGAGVCLAGGNVHYSLGGCGQQNAVIHAVGVSHQFLQSTQPLHAGNIGAVVNLGVGNVDIQHLSQLHTDCVIVRHDEQTILECQIARVLQLEALGLHIAGFPI